MKIFFASACSSKIHNECWVECDVRRLLFSYANDEALFRANRHLYENSKMEILVDSGAFTAWTKGKNIDLLQYADFCSRVTALSSAKLKFINLDVIPGEFRRKPTREEIAHSAERGWRNFEVLRSCGIPVMHVFHQHEDFRWLERLSCHSDYIGVSPANDVSPKERRIWLARVFRAIGTRVRTHGFGVTTVDLMEKFPFYSVDSTSWLAPSLYGAITVFRGIEAGVTPRLVSVTKDKWRSNLDIVAQHFVPSLEGYKYVTNLSLQAYGQLERYVTSLWEERGVRWE